MARLPKKPSTKSLNKLLEAVSFLSCVTKEQGAPYETHINLSYNTAVAYNDILSAGVLISEDIAAAPNASVLRKALAKCGHEYTITIDALKLIIKSGKFKAIVPCVLPELLATRIPDPPCAALDERFKEALSVIDVLKPEPNADKIHLLAFLMNGQSVITTDGKIVIERWVNEASPKWPPNLWNPARRALLALKTLEQSDVPEPMVREAAKDLADFTTAYAAHTSKGE